MPVIQRRKFYINIWVVIALNVVVTSRPEIAISSQFVTHIGNGSVTLKALTTLLQFEICLLQMVPSFLIE